MYKYISWIMVLLWMLLIFNLSNQPASESNSLSKGASKVIVKNVEVIAPQVELDLSSFNNQLRKHAHFFVYLGLGMLVLFSLRRTKLNRYASALLTLVICVLFAITDELHQLFVPGRGAQLKDVLIDSAGVFTGIIVYLLLGRISARHPNNSEN